MIPATSNTAPDGSGGAGLVDRFARIAKAEGVDIRYAYAAEELVVADGRIAGVIISSGEQRETLPADPTEATLLERLTHEPLHVDELTRAAGLPAAMVTATLTLLELKGLARQIAPMQYVRA